MVLAMAAVMWVVEIIDQLDGGALERYGIRPRDVDGLVGVATAPFLHGGFDHLLGNTVPFLILGAMIALSGVVRVLQATLVIALVAGLGTWLTGPAGSDHIGASGIVVGYATYLIARGVMGRSLLKLLAGLLVLALYGPTVVFSLVPTDGVSWQSHLFGAVGGVVAAWTLDRRRPAPNALPS